MGIPFCAPYGKSRANSNVKLSYVISMVWQSMAEVGQVKDFKMKDEFISGISK